MEWLGDNLWAAWLGVALVLVIAELVTLDLIMLMLGAGALSAAITAGFTDAWAVQVIVGVVVSVGLLAVVRPSLARRLHGGSDLLVGPQRLIGVQVITPVALNDLDHAQLKLDGELWAARPFAGVGPIPSGTAVVVVAIDGATALVVPVGTVTS